MKRESAVAFETQVTASSNTNNFDLIRLFAATQVAIVHAAVHLGVYGKWTDVFNIFPGVPIFFFISGFLIYQSWANIGENKIGTFSVNRILRLFPALYFCFALSVSSILFSGYLNSSYLTTKNFMIWVAAQLTFFQFFNPEFMREYGTGVVNGSLWTICVELQFYVLTPFIYLLLKRSTKGFVAITLLLAVANILNSHLNDRYSVSGKLFAVSFIPWVWMFMVGAYMSTNRSLREKIIETKWSALLLTYLSIYALSVFFHLGAGNEINPLLYVTLAAIVLKAAYTAPTLSNKFLNKNDISYGVYIFHMPIINFLLYKKNAGWGAVAISIAATFIFATVSWIFVEKPALNLKRVALRKLS